MRHDLDRWLTAYIEGAGLSAAPKGSVKFRAGLRRCSSLTDRSMSPHPVLHAADP